METHSNSETKCANAPNTRSPSLDAEAGQVRLDCEHVHSARSYNEQLKSFILKIIDITPIPACYQSYSLDPPSEWEIQKRMESRRAWYEMHHYVQQYLAKALNALPMHCATDEYRENVLRIFKRTNSQLSAKERFYRGDIQEEFNQTIRDNVIVLPFFNLISAENWLDGASGNAEQNEAYIKQLAPQPKAPAKTEVIAPEAKEIIESSVPEPNEIIESDTELEKIAAHSRKLIRNVVGWGLFVIVIMSIAALVIKH